MLKHAGYLLAAVLGVSLVAGTGCSGAMSSELDSEKQSILGLMPGPGVAADVVGVAADPETARLIVALNEVMATASWLDAYFEDLPAGEPMPYDARFGLTEEEFQMVTTAMEGTTVGTTLISGREAGGLYELSGTTSGGDLDGFFLNTESLRFETPYGVTEGPEVHQGFESGASTNGWMWRIAPGDGDEELNSSVLTLSLVSRASDDRSHLTITAAKFEDGQVIRTHDVDLIFEPVG